MGIGTVSCMSAIAPYDRDALRRSFHSARPFPFLAMDDFFSKGIADAAAESFLPYDQARLNGHEFRALNENKKVGIADPAKFPSAITAIADALSSRQFMDDLSYITDIPDLLWDPDFGGGGMHQTGETGWLDVHVDFNFLETRKWHRRLNVLIYLNPGWDESWGGTLELWDRKVKHRVQAFAPIHNRCVIFETSDISYHGVTAVKCPPGEQRCSFAAYYYTEAPPAGWQGEKHTTIFRARPDELWKKHFQMPAASLRGAAIRAKHRVKHGVKTVIYRNEP